MIASLNREGYNQKTEQEYSWLDYTKKVLYGDNGTSATTAILTRKTMSLKF